MSQKPAKVFTYATFSIPALTTLAETHRKIRCLCASSQTPQSGAFNWVIFLVFEDGVEWVFRSPIKSYELEPESLGELLESEVATMRYLRENSNVPVPQIYDYCKTGDNDVGVPFILMSKAEGVPLSEFAWDEILKPEGRSTGRKTLPVLTRPNKEKIMNQLGGIAAQLSQMRFDKLGSLCFEDGEYCVKKCLYPALIFHSRDCLEDDVPRGPFQRESEFYEALLETFLLHVKELRIERNVFFAPIPKPAEYDTYYHHRKACDYWNDFVAIGGKVENTRNRVDYAMVGHFLRKMIPSICQQASENSVKFEGYPISHPDLSTSNIFIDYDFNITCIIDWGFSSTVPIPTLLTTPSFPHARDDIDLTLSPIFKMGFDNYLAQHKETSTPSQIWNTTREAWLFTRLVMLDGLQDYHCFTELYSLIFRPEEEPNIPLMFWELRQEKEFVELAEELVGYERPMEKIKKDEEESFPESDEGVRLKAVARKLTMCSLFSREFVADRRLWKWLADALE